MLPPAIACFHISSYAETFIGIMEEIQNTRFTVLRITSPLGVSLWPRTILVVLCRRFYWSENGCTGIYILNMVYKYPCPSHQQIYLIFTAKGIEILTPGLYLFSGASTPNQPPFGTCIQDQRQDLGYTQPPC